jgi:hypothetical protein|tara:strand:- start:174 stop:461 length:288 start_codon:yes stop_codon:yes gene_type:complete
MLKQEMQCISVTDNLKQNIMEAQLSFWNRSMSDTFSVYVTFKSISHYEKYVAKMESLGYTFDEVWTENVPLKRYLRKGFDKAIKDSKIKVTFLRN